MTFVDFSELEGKVLTEVRNYDNIRLTFVCEDGSEYVMQHYQDCCEDVWLEDIAGDFDSLLGQPILLAEEVYEEGDPLEDFHESYTWTFYKLVTNRGYVTLRWYGTSNGYYSETVTFERVK